MEIDIDVSKVWSFLFYVTAIFAEEFESIEIVKNYSSSYRLIESNSLCQVYILMGVFMYKRISSI